MSYILIDDIVKALPLIRDVVRVTHNVTRHITPVRASTSEAGIETCSSMTSAQRLLAFKLIYYKFKILLMSFMDKAIYFFAESS